MVIFPQQGACFCGDVRYALGEDPLTLYACHCTDCQRQTGSSFVLSMVVRGESLELLQGELCDYSSELPDGRQKHSRFCGRCSTRLWGRASRFPELAVLRPGTLDDTSWIHPIGHIWTRSAQPWVRIPRDTLNFEQQPQGDEVMAMVRAWRARTSK